MNNKGIFTCKNKKRKIDVRNYNAYQRKGKKQKEENYAATCTTRNSKRTANGKSRPEGKRRSRRKRQASFPNDVTTLVSGKTDVTMRSVRPRKDREGNVTRSIVGVPR